MTVVLIYAWLTVGELTVLGVLLTDGTPDLRAMLTSVVSGTAGALLLGCFAWLESAEGAWGAPAGVSLGAAMLGAGAGLAIVLLWGRWLNRPAPMRPVHWAGHRAQLIRAARRRDERGAARR